MKKLLCSAIGILLLAACAPNVEQAVRVEIEVANHCEQTADCVVVMAVCPFDCYVPAHKDEAAKLEATFQSYETTCAYSCLPVPAVSCEAGKCVLAQQ
jgi:hypothetical protein